MLCNATAACNPAATVLLRTGTTKTISTFMGSSLAVEITTSTAHTHVTIRFFHPLQPPTLATEPPKCCTTRQGQRRPLLSKQKGRDQRPRNRGSTSAFGQGPGQKATVALVTLVTYVRVSQRNLPRTRSTLSGSTHG